MPEFVVERTMKILNGFKKSLNGAKVLLLGVAYKNDIDDMRESPALKIIEHLQKNNAKVFYHDIYIPELKFKGKVYKSVDLNDRTLKGIDIVIITTDHSNVDYQFVVDQVPVVFDTRNATKYLSGTSKIVKL